LVGPLGCYHDCGGNNDCSKRAIPELGFRGFYTETYKALPWAGEHSEGNGYKWVAIQNGELNTEYWKGNDWESATQWGHVSGGCGALGR
jgi:hypothetical protein